MVIGQDVEKELRDFFAPYNRVLKQMMGKDLNLALWKLDDEESDVSSSMNDER